tara:strand:+ start:3364 stop:3960 length:597 start_codon:yes stop_codon:yes gene_type:complete
MACTALTKGRGLDCNRISGGVKFIYFAVFDQVISTTIGTGADKGSITDINMGLNGTAPAELYRYALPNGVTSINDTVVGSRENGTIYYTPTANVVFNRLTKEDQNEVKLLGATKTIIFAQLNQQILGTGHDVIVCLGRGQGMEMNAGTIDSGAAWGDRNGYTMTFDGMEQDPFYMVQDYTLTPFDNIDGGTQIPITAV